MLGHKLKQSALSGQVDPIWVFIAIAISFFAIDALNSAFLNKPKIVISNSTKTLIINNEQSLHGREITDAEKAQAIEEYINEEIMLREALRLQLDEDYAIRKKLLNKLAFIWATALREPSDAELQAYLEENSEKFEPPPKWDVEQIYFNKEKVPENFLETLSEPSSLNESVSLGEHSARFPSLFKNVSVRDLHIRVSKQVADAVSSLALNAWAGPFESSSGQHFIRIVHEYPALAPKLEEIKRYVRDAWHKDEREKIIESKLKTLRDQYQIELEETR